MLALRNSPAILACFSVGLAMAGCASTGFLMARPKVLLYGESYPPRADTSAIEVFHAQRPSREFVEIGKIEVADTDDSWSIRQIRIKAREIGADAVIIIGKSGSYATGIPVGSQSVAVAQDYGMVAVAIRYK